nr:MAG TPA_asm: hypothetical protein [Caudoviricetes sp.]DAL51569.1 MAG TPA_asm: hypothetical protein [Caudoviricetes sp.]DAQ88775.1 MAG TPA: hypothetical protein [Caudoviricetes sp.]
MGNRLISQFPSEMDTQVSRSVDTLNLISDCCGGSVVPFSL